MALYLRMHLFVGSSLKWLEKLLAGASAVRDLSVGFGCPIHCGSSLAIPFALGFSSGIIIGFCAALALIFLLKSQLSAQQPFPTAPSPAPQFPGRRRERIAGYLHEQ